MLQIREKSDLDLSGGGGGRGHLEDGDVYDLLDQGRFLMREIGNRQTDRD